MDLIYFDNSATTKPHKEVADEVILCMESYFANPSSAHRLGMEAEKKLRGAREKVSKLIGAAPQEIIFTSGGSEANNIAITGAVGAGEHIISSQIEHPSVLRLLKSLEEKGCEVTYLDVDRQGIIDLAQLKEAIKDNTRLVTIMHVNNETGVIQPIGEIAKTLRAHSKKAKLHIDAVQSLGKMKVDVKALDVDMLSLSAHKIHGPKGVGALYVKRGLRLRPFIIGGEQETGLRAGTENLPGISGFGVAAEMAAKDIESKISHVKALKAHFIKGLSAIEEIRINSPEDDVHIPHILNVSFEGTKGEVLLHALEDYHIYVSTGSACAAKKASHQNYVLPALGLTEKEMLGAIRFSFSYMNTLDEVDKTIDALKKILPFLRRIRK